MIKLIIFDLSGVCFTNEEDPFIKDFASVHDLDQEAMNVMYNKWISQAESGGISGTEAWHHILFHFDMEGSPEEIIKEMMHYRKPVPEMIILVAQLRKNYKVAYLTNYNQHYWDAYTKQFNIDAHFDFGVRSDQIRARKPDPKCFQTVMDHFHVKPEETVFIDDTEKHVRGAQLLKINAIHFKNKAQLFEELKKRGIKI